MGLEQAKSFVESISNEAITMLHSLDNKNEFLEMLLTELIHREK